jgi:hypothetical protein
VEPTDTRSPEQDVSDESNGAELLPPDTQALVRAKGVAQRITERVRKALGDTQPDHTALPPEPTEEHPPAP